jgi:diaminopimelate epimerase
MHITKMHGIGNSYVIIEDLGGKLRSRYSSIARKISDKSFGIGSDGILIVTRGKKAKYWMRIFNPDGSEAEMCGNGIRIFTRYLFDKEMIGKEATIEVGGSKGGRIAKTQINGKMITVDMGKCEIRGAKAIEAGGKKFEGISVSIGNPHFVIFSRSEAEAEENAQKYGSVIENHRSFPKRTNVEFVFPKKNDELIVHVWERGAGNTLACGTGACASAFASYKDKKTGKKVKVRLPGGVLGIEIKNDNKVMMSGPAEYIFSANIKI